MNKDEVVKMIRGGDLMIAPYSSNRKKSVFPSKLTRTSNKNIESVTRRRTWGGVSRMGRYKVTTFQIGCSGTSKRHKRKDETGAMMGEHKRFCTKIKSNFFPN